MNRAEFQRLARTRARDGSVLLDARRWEGAYYLLGYAIECALKAVICTQTREFDFPDKDRVNKSHTHNLANLLELSVLAPRLVEAAEEDPVIAANWSTVKDWNERRRYERTTEVKARDLPRAVTDKRRGILKWIADRWDQ